MTIMGGAEPGRPPSLSLPDDWPAKAADSLEGAVAAVRARTVRPLQIASRAIVYGIIVGIMGAILMILIAIGVIRLLDVYAFPTEVWASYLVVGGIFGLSGLFLSSLKRAKPKR